VFFQVPRPSLGICSIESYIGKESIKNLASENGSTKIEQLEPLFKFNAAEDAL
jgi:hypothetical protein